MAPGVRGLSLELAQRVVADVVDQGGLARAADTRHAHQPPERDLHIDVLQVVLGARLDLRERERACLRATLARSRAFAVKYCAVSERLERSSSRGVPEENHLAALLTRTRAKVENAVGGRA